MNRSFTLIETIVVIGIIALLTALILPNYRVGQRQFALQRSAHKLSQDLRRAQEMAMSAALSEETGGEVPEGGYGIQLEETNTYILFGDKNSNHSYDSGSDYWIEAPEIEKEVTIKNFQVPGDERDKITVTFVPPDPQVLIKSPLGLELQWVKIILALKQDPDITMTVYVNKAGLITVE